MPEPMLQDAELSSGPPQDFEAAEVEEISPEASCVTDFINAGAQRIHVGSIVTTLYDGQRATPEEFKVLCGKLRADERIKYIGEGFYEVVKEPAAIDPNPPKDPSSPKEVSVAPPKKERKQEPDDAKTESMEAILQRAIGVLAVSEDFEGVATTGQLASAAFGWEKASDERFSQFLAAIRRSRNLLFMGSNTFRVFTDDIDLEAARIRQLDETIPIGQDRVVEVSTFDGLLRTWKKDNGRSRGRPRSRRRPHFKKGAIMSGFGEGFDSEEPS